MGYFEKGILKDLRTKNWYFFGITALFRIIWRA